jgi:hypothetical protein
MNEPTHNKHTMRRKLLFLGLDVHAQNIALAFAEGGGGEARSYGTIPNCTPWEKVLSKSRAPRIRAMECADLSALSCRRH